MSAAAIAIGAGQGIGAGIGLFGGFRFVRWLVEFTFKRKDLRLARLDARELALEARFNTRLRHVEQELDKYREATMLLVNALADKDPQNQALRDVGRILRGAVPMDPKSDDKDADLMGKLDKIP